MYFMFEAFHRRPLESRALAYTRITFAVVFTILFFVYCGYLINQVSLSDEKSTTMMLTSLPSRQIKFDNPLLRLSTEHIKDEYEMPHVEVCAQNTTLTFVRCDLMYMNWSTISTPDCYKYIRFGTFLPTDVSRCYLFESNGTIHYGVKDPSLYAADATQIRRVDIYWKIDSIQNITAASVGIPAITMMLYDIRFSRWNEMSANMIPQQAIFENEMAQGNYRSTSTQNYTSTIFFTPSKYRAIRPGDAGSLMGFAPQYVDIYTITATQLDWPIHIADNPDIQNGVYQGLFSVQLAKTTYEVQTEQRQHTLLSAIALVGGAYGVIITMYTLMFGMVRHSPWGAAHQIPLNMIRIYDTIHGSRAASGKAQSNGDQENRRTMTWKHYLFRRSFFIPRASSSLSTASAAAPQARNAGGGGSSGSKRTDDAGGEGGRLSQDPATIMLTTEHLHPLKMAHQQGGGGGGSSSSSSSSSSTPIVCNTADKSDGHALTMDRLNHLQNLCERLIDEQEKNNRRVAQFEDRLFEIQEVLRQYYINMDYLDCVRDMRRRRPQSSWNGHGRTRMSNSSLGGWLLAGDEEHYQQQA
ncbi:hypothetical protein BX666DRAFT_776034 [Dichotomocladium elegans]|nr:hypothetical protein BX666DRAFT_776034 [Dichotomocladium elegans]